MKKSQSQEDYLKFIHEAGHGQYVSNKEIATGLNVAPPSVSEMITKLAQEGLVDVDNGAVVNLTTDTFFSIKPLFSSSFKQFDNTLLLKFGLSS